MGLFSPPSIAVGVFFPRELADGAAAIVGHEQIAAVVEGQGDRIVHPGQRGDGRGAALCDLLTVLLPRLATNRSPLGSNAIAQGLLAPVRVALAVGPRPLNSRRSSSGSMASLRPSRLRSRWFVRLRPIFEACDAIANVSR